MVGINGEARGTPRKGGVLSAFKAHVPLGSFEQCWEWTGSRDKEGYGRFGWHYETHKAHRYAYEVFWGVVPAEWSVCHTCDNPPCVNPLHLFLGTTTDNLNDMVKKGRSNHGQRNGRAKITDGQAEELRALYATGEWTQQALAEHFGLKQPQVSHIIIGRSRAKSSANTRLMS